MLPALRLCRVCCLAGAWLTAACGDEILVSLLAPERAPAPDPSSTNPATTGSTLTSELDAAAAVSNDSNASDSAATAAHSAASPSSAGEPGLDAAVSDAAVPDSPGLDASVTDPTADAPTAAPSPVLLHHYDFSGSGVNVLDRVGAAHGVALGGAALDESGALTLDGDDDYVDLPNGLISGLEAVTFAVWLEWYGGGCWQRIFDFGNSPDGEDMATQAETSLFLTPASCQVSHVGPVDQFVLSAMFHVRGSAYTLQHAVGLATEVRAHLVLSAAPDSGLTLYLDGQQVAQLPAPLFVSEIQDVNNWLGRSQWGQDDYLAARLLDLRLYDGTLTPEQVTALYLETQADP